MTVSPPPDAPIYLDNNATTRIDDRVFEAMLPWLREGYGNPSSAHQLGQPAARAVARARAQVARLVGARSPREIVFTSGGTESINAAIHAAACLAGARRRVVTSKVEHSASLNPAVRLGRSAGRELVLLDVDGEGRLDVEQALGAIDADCALVTLIWGNNETGVLLPEQDLARIGERCREVGAYLHVDAVQVAGKLTLRVGELPIDFLSISAHKFHGPKGSGALYVRSGLEVEAFLDGGTQEEGRRGGTHNTPGIVGLGAAAELAREHAADARALAHLAALRDRLETGLLAALPDCIPHGRGAQRVANTANLAFPGLKGEAVLMLLSEHGVCVSTGSACSTLKRTPSRVLSAMGCSDEEAGASIRFSLCRDTRPEEIERALAIVPRVIAELRALAPDTADAPAS
jgi:cysteine desulfurase